MPSKNPKPRVAVSLTPGTFAIFKRFGQLSDKPMASCIAELLEASSVEFANLCQLLAQANALKNESQDKQAKFLETITAVSNAAQSGQGSLSLLIHDVTGTAAPDFTEPESVTTMSATPDDEQRRSGVGRTEQTTAGKARKKGSKT